MGIRTGEFRNELRLCNY